MNTTPLGTSSNYFLSFDGIVNHIYLNLNSEGNDKRSQRQADQYIRKVTCPICQGARLNREALHFRLDDKNIAELAGMDIIELYRWFEGIEERMSKRQLTIVPHIAGATIESQAKAAFITLDLVKRHYAEKDR